MLVSRFALLTASSLLFISLTAGCGSNVESPTGSSSGAGGSSSGAGSGSSSSGEFDAGAMVTTIDKEMGPITAQSGTETTQCITVNLNNPEGAFVRRFRADLGAGSHHMIVYTSVKTVEQPIPQACASFSGILAGEHPIFIAQQPHAELIFPTDDNGVPVGFEIQPNQMVKLEMHYINTTNAPLDVTGKISLDTVSLATTVTKSDLAFWGTTQISIPANSIGDTGVRYQSALSGTKTFALTTHQHKLGTEMLVWYSTGKNDTSTMVADGKNWADPPLEIFSPPLDFPTNGANTFSTKGLAYQCKWNNNTPNTVTFGEAFNDEMCFLWQYYFPSQGFQACVDGFCKKTL
jgi:Copper type II ascorbate-dependent monooxygenase, C-terminal domain